MIGQAETPTKIPEPRLSLSRNSDSTTIRRSLTEGDPQAVGLQLNVGWVHGGPSDGKFTHGA